jgi:hypothetical protein
VRAPHPVCRAQFGKQQHEVMCSKSIRNILFYLKILIKYSEEINIIDMFDLESELGIFVVYTVGTVYLYSILSLSLRDLIDPSHNTLKVR